MAYLSELDVKPGRRVRPSRLCPAPRCAIVRHARRAVARSTGASPPAGAARRAPITAALFSAVCEMGLEGVVAKKCSTTAPTGVGQGRVPESDWLYARLAFWLSAHSSTCTPSLVAVRRGGSPDNPLGGRGSSREVRRRDQGGHSAVSLFQGRCERAPVHGHVQKRPSCRPSGSASSCRRGRVGRRDPARDGVQDAARPRPCGSRSASTRRAG